MGDDWRVRMIDEGVLYVTLWLESDQGTRTTPDITVLDSAFTFIPS